MPEKLSEMSVKLEEIQKALDMYLETKRQIFPRLYFLSNDDLVEILGQSQNPKAVQPHLKKCFDNIKSLHLNEPRVHIYSSATLLLKQSLQKLNLVLSGWHCFFKILDSSIYLQKHLKATSIGLHFATFIALLLFFRNILY